MGIFEKVKKIFDPKEAPVPAEPKLSLMRTERSYSDPKILSPRSSKPKSVPLAEFGSKLICQITYEFNEDLLKQQGEIQWPNRESALSADLYILCEVISSSREELILTYILALKTIINCCSVIITKHALASQNESYIKVHLDAMKKDFFLTFERAFQKEFGEIDNICTRKEANLTLHILNSSRWGIIEALKELRSVLEKVPTPLVNQLATSLLSMIEYALNVAIGTLEACALDQQYTFEQYLELAKSVKKKQAHIKERLAFLEIDLKDEKSISPPTSPVVSPRSPKSNGRSRTGSFITKLSPRQAFADEQQNSSTSYNSDIFYKIEMDPEFKPYKAGLDKRVKDLLFHTGYDALFKNFDEKKLKMLSEKLRMSSTNLRMSSSRVSQRSSASGAVP